MRERIKYMAPGEGTRYEVFGGDIVCVKATSEDTEGRSTVIETTTPSQCGPPPHIHKHEDETFYVIEGQFEFQIGKQTVQATAGAFLVAPRGIPHRFTNIGATPGKLLITITPGGFEKFIAAFAELPPNEPPDFKRMMAIGAEHGIELVPPG